MFGSEAKVRFTAQIFKGQLLEPFSQGDWNQGLGRTWIRSPRRPTASARRCACIGSPTSQRRARQLLRHGAAGGHGRDSWSYKIISIHGQAGGHAVAAFVAADAVFFDPNHGIFYFDQADDFRQWFGEPGGYYWESNYVRELGDDFTIKSYAPSM